MALTAKDCAYLRLRTDRFGQTTIDNQLLLELIDLAECAFGPDGKPGSKLEQEIGYLEDAVRDIEDVVSILESSIRDLKRRRE